jgi:hypothetical protein
MVKNALMPPQWRRSWPPILAGLVWTVAIVLLTAWWLHKPAPPPWTPPMLTHSLAVVVEDGEPARVIEHRTIERAFDGDWVVRVVRVGDGVPEVICTRPPDAKSYEARYSTIGESFLSLPFDEYIGDPDGTCRARMKPGNHIIVTERGDITDGTRKALDLLSSPTFEVARP